MQFIQLVNIVVNKLQGLETSNEVVTQPSLNHEAEESPRTGTASCSPFIYVHTCIFMYLAQWNGTFLYRETFWTLEMLLLGVKFNLDVLVVTEVVLV